MNDNLIIFNARSIKYKWNDICSEISTYHASIIAVTETWICDEISQYYLCNDYNRFAKCRSGCEGEGVLLFFAPRYTVTEFSPLVPAPQSCEMLCVKDASTCQHWVLIYRPRHDIPEAETRQLHDAIEALIKLNPKTVILRDLNYRGIDWLCKDGPAALNAISCEFIELCASCDFTQIVNKPTWLDKCLDLILTSDSENVLAVDVHPPVLHGKDHNLVECKWKFRTAESKLGIPRRNFARVD